MAEYLNAKCKVCGKLYHKCDSCYEQKVVTPWKAVTDTAEHYKIYTAIHKYTVKGDKETARKELNNCDLSDSDNYLTNIQMAINDIMTTTEKKKSKSAPKVEEKVIEDIDVEVLNVEEVPGEVDNIE